MQEISPKDAAKALADGSAVVIDVREHAELAEAEVPGTMHIPMGEIPDRVDEISKDDNIIVMCKMGGRSAMVCDYLSSQGYTKIANLTGGIYAWGSEVDESVIK